MSKKKLLMHFEKIFSSTKEYTVPTRFVKKKRDRQEILPVTKNEEEEEEEEEKEVLINTLKTNSIEDHALDIQNQQDLIFIKRLKQSGKSEQVINVRPLPSRTDVFRYISSLKDKPHWFKEMQHQIVNSKTLKFPDMWVLTRAFIFGGFMRAAMKNTEEEACKNINCEAEKHHGFRLRVLGIPDNHWCYLCHLAFTNSLFLQSLSRKSDNERCYQIHYFMVSVDVPGEYKLEKTLQGEEDVRGLFGPFPWYNVNNYIVKPGTQEIVESDSMVFRLSQTTSSNQIEFSQTTL